MSTKLKNLFVGSEISTPVIVIAIAQIIFTGVMVYRSYSAETNLLSISAIAMLAGLILESIRITKNWQALVALFVISYFLSLFAFLPSSDEYIYTFDNHITTWSYAFITTYAFFFSIFLKDKTIARLNEGSTLLLSVSFIYWWIDYGFSVDISWTSGTLLIFGGILSLFSIINAFTNLTLSNTSRIFLSVWSSIIMFAFAGDNILKVLNNPAIENTYFSEGLFIGLQYFLLGVSAVYIVSNYMLIIRFFPSKSGNYNSELAEVKQDHLNRYSQEQISLSSALLCVAFSAITYSLNYWFDILPKHTLIWIVLITFPMFIHILESAKNKSI